MIGTNRRRNKKGRCDSGTLCLSSTPGWNTTDPSPHLKEVSCLVYLSTTLSLVSTVQFNFFLYCVAKGAVEQMTRTLAQDLGSKGINRQPCTDGFCHRLTYPQIKFFARPESGWSFGTSRLPESMQWLDFTCQRRHGCLKKTEDVYKIS
ncbi:hypothetical protein EDD21DRAFT_187412 [Dissophora ornata]|nr:hypothetical protein EDD21DRAFT_187412 [Dissophora ornata]